MDLYVLECPNHDLTISEKCLSVCLDVCPYMWQKFYGKCGSTTNAQNFMKFKILNYTAINWYLSTFEGNRSTGGAVIVLFLEFSGHAYLEFYSLKLRKKLCTTYVWLNTAMMQFKYIQNNRRRCYSVLFQIHVLVLL